MQVLTVSQYEHSLYQKLDYSLYNILTPYLLHTETRDETCLQANTMHSVCYLYFLVMYKIDLTLSLHKVTYIF